MKLTENFSLPEFQSKDFGFFPEDVKVNIQKLANNLQVLRDHFGSAITINSGYRSPAHNERIGGVKNSYHVKGMAADIVIKGVSPYALAKQIEMLIDGGKMTQGGIGIYDTFTHYDIRGHAARWNQQTKK
jgi:uncharacterized protein YcbK (DUF882 family)